MLQTGNLRQKENFPDCRPVSTPLPTAKFFISAICFANKVKLPGQLAFNVHHALRKFGCPGSGLCSLRRDIHGDPGMAAIMALGRSSDRVSTVPVAPGHLQYHNRLHSDTWTVLVWERGYLIAAPACLTIC